jgi:hypothetical protein
MLSSLTKMKRDFSLLQANEKSFLEGAMGSITYLGQSMSTCNSNEKKKKKQYVHNLSKSSKITKPSMTCQVNLLFLTLKINKFRFNYIILITYIFIITISFCKLLLDFCQYDMYLN